ncbi:MAG TPA: hypothetical protein VLF20_02660 [Patescibacteria group bacterium]|nr:hypothetical protein [Patescibacteria group bacterium]
MFFERYLRRDRGLSPQELLDTTFVCFQDGRRKVGNFISPRWRLSIQEVTEEGIPRLVIRKSSNRPFQNTGELAIIAPSPGSLSYFKIVNGRVRESFINSRIAVNKINGLLSEAVIV